MLVNKNLFPFESIRPQQNDIIDELNKIPLDKKYIFLQCGTGVGKSALAVSIARTQGRAFILTTSKQLQDQYTNDFSDIGLVSLKGKSNYPCYLTDDILDCSNGPCVGMPELVQRCGENCSYYRKRNEANKSQIFCTNYSYFFSSGGNYLNKRNVIIFDEAHNLENELVSFASINIFPLRIVEKSVGDKFSTKDAMFCNRARDLSSSNDIHEWLCELNSNYIDNSCKELRQKISEMSSSHKDIKDRSALKKLEMLNKDLSMFENLESKIKLVEKKKDDFIYEALIEDDKVKIKVTPFNPSFILKNFIKDSRVIFMSATLLDFETFSEAIGIEKEESAFLSFESTFDPSKSPIYTLKSVNLSYKNLSNKNEIERLYDTIRFIADHHPNEKGIIHTGNMSITKLLYERFYEDERFLFRFEGITNQIIYKDHITSEDPTILVSSSMLDGVDLYDDLSRFQVICKMPFLSLGDRRISLKAEKYPNWYDLQMWQRIIQASGRSTRSEEDSSVTYVLDKLWGWSYSKAKERGILPQQFIKRVRSV